MRKENDYFALIIEGLLVFMILMAVPTLVSSYDASYGIPISALTIILGLIMFVFYRTRGASKCETVKRSADSNKQALCPRQGIAPVCCWSFHRGRR